MPKKNEIKGLIFLLDSFVLAHSDLVDFHVIGRQEAKQWEFNSLPSWNGVLSKVLIVKPTPTPKFKTSGLKRCEKCTPLVKQQKHF